jgi:hypothetical protein
MSVVAIFKYAVKPGGMADFMAKLGRAAEPRFNSPVMPKSDRLFRSAVPGPDTSGVILHLEYEDMAAYGARTAFENGNAEWRALFEATPESPETLLAVELLVEVPPA